jgi:multicomponent Na+:H+ antiporter subunit B
MIMFGIYLIINGQFTPGGGFQGGLAVAVFFICRYMIYDIYDVQIKKVIKLEELIFASTVFMAILVVFLKAASALPGQYLILFQNAYLFTMNMLIGMKVACAFFILFYRYITIERR